jgi:hypothetical protein
MQEQVRREAAAAPDRVTPVALWTFQPRAPRLARSLAPVAEDEARTAAAVRATGAAAGGCRAGALAAGAPDAAGTGADDANADADAADAAVSAEASTASVVSTS